MSQSTLAHAAALAALAGLVEHFRQDGVVLGLESLRVLRSHRLTWSDLFGPLAAAEPVFRTSDDLAESWAISAAASAARVMEDLFLFTPAELALAATLLCRGPRAIEEPDRVGLLLRKGDERLQINIAANAHSIGVPGRPFWPLAGAKQA